MRKLFAVVVMGIFFIGIAAAQSTYAQCDRQCLEGFVNEYLTAMVAHDASKAPFATNVKFTENAKLLPLGKTMEGLWFTATNLDDYKFYVADPTTGQIAFVGLVKRAKNPRSFQCGSKSKIIKSPKLSRSSSGI